MSLNFIIINEDQDFTTSLSQILEMDDHKVQTFSTPKATAEIFDEGFSGIVVVDYAERKIAIADLVSAIATKSPDARIIITATPDKVSAAKALNAVNLMGVLAKPINFDELDALLELAPSSGTSIDIEDEQQTADAVSSTQLTDAIVLKETVEPAAHPQATEVAQKKQDPLVVVGHSDIAKTLREQWQTLLGRNEDIILIGDKGVGKSSFIRALNLDSPTVEVQCAKLDRKTSDRELFGQDEQGLNLSGREESFLDQALGGTLALYDVEQLPPSTQEALQRVIKTRQEMAAAGNAKLFNFRLIATSTFDLRELAAQRKFSPILLNAIEPVFVKIAPLRERGIDPVMMFEMAMQLAAGELQVNCPEMTPKLASALSAYNWPGNLRELRQAARNYVMEQTGASAETLNQPGEVISLASTRRA